MNSALSWAAWLAWKEARWRPLWLSLPAAVFALLVGFSSHTVRPAAWADLSGDARVALVILLLGACVGLPLKAQWDAAAVAGEFAADGESFDAPAVRAWLRLRAAAVAAEAVAAAAAGTALAAAVNVSGTPHAIDWYFSGLFALSAGAVVFLVLARGRRRVGPAFPEAA